MSPMDKFCPKCGGELAEQWIEAEETTQQRCTSCAAIHYKNSKPTSSVLAIRDGAVLLIKRGIEPYKGWWDIPGGFLNSGEHPEDGAKREFLEETGLEIRLTHMLGFWMDKYGPIDLDILNICYAAEVLGGHAQASTDAVEIGWFPLDALPEQVAFDWSKSALDALKVWHAGLD